MELPQLAVVIAALARKRPALAFANIFGSCVSNILGSFSLGLIFGHFAACIAHPSEKLYTALLLVLNLAVLLVVGLGAASKGMGAGLVGFFAVYLAAIFLGQPVAASGRILLIIRQGFTRVS
jgi:Ca2+/Na+ antiporter